MNYTNVANDTTHIVSVRGHIPVIRDLILFSEQEILDIIQMFY